MAKPKPGNATSMNLRKLINDNNVYFRSVLYTVPKKIQLVMYRLKPSESIHREIHKKNVQFLYVESGNGIIIIDHGKKTEPVVYDISEGWCGIIEPNTYHIVHNESDTHDLKMFSIYVPDEFGPDRTDVNNVE